MVKTYHIPCRAELRNVCLEEPVINGTMSADIGMYSPICSADTLLGGLLPCSKGPGISLVLG